MTYHELLTEQFQEKLRKTAVPIPSNVLAGLHALKEYVDAKVGDIHNFEVELKKYSVQDEKNRRNTY